MYLFRLLNLTNISWCPRHKLIQGFTEFHLSEEILQTNRKIESGITYCKPFPKKQNFHVQKGRNSWLSFDCLRCSVICLRGSLSLSQWDLDEKIAAVSVWREMVLLPRSECSKIILPADLFNLFYGGYVKDYLLSGCSVFPEVLLF